MIQVPFLEKKDIQTIIVSLQKVKRERIPNPVNVTNEYVEPNQIKEIFDDGIEIERKAYIVESIVNNDSLLRKKTLFEQRFCQTKNEIKGRIDYLPKLFYYHNKIKQAADLKTCQIAKTLIKNYLQTPNIKCNLYGIGLIDNNIIYLKQLIVFEIIHFNSSQPEKSIEHLIRKDFIPKKRPFI